MKEGTAMSDFPASMFFFFFFSVKTYLNEISVLECNLTCKHVYNFVDVYIFFQF